jgi:hypothetical protein
MVEDLLHSAESAALEACEHLRQLEALGRVVKRLGPR